MKKKYSTLPESAILDRYFLTYPEKLRLVENGAEVQLMENVIIIKNPGGENRIDLLEEVNIIGMELFDTEKFFNRWMNTKSKVFGYKRPIELIESLEGIEKVLEELSNIEHGLFL